MSGNLFDLQRLGQQFDRSQIAGGAVCNPARGRACNCVGPQNGDPVCPCMMGAYREREMHRRSHETLMKILAERDGEPAVLAPSPFLEN